MYEIKEIDTLGELVRAVQDIRTGGYEVDFDIQPNAERSRSGDGFFLVIGVRDSTPGSDNITGEWWFFNDNTVMQVL